MSSVAPCARARPGQGQAPRCRSLGLAGSRFFFLTGRRAVTDNKSDDLVACARFERWSFFCSRVNNHRFLLFECLVCCVLLCLGVPCRLFPHTKPKNKTRCLLQWRPRGRRSRTWRGCWAPVGLNWNPSVSLGGIVVDSLLAGSAGIAELAIFHPVRSPDDLRLQNSDVRSVRDGKWGADGLVTDRSIPLRSAS